MEMMEDGVDDDLAPLTLTSTSPPSSRTPYFRRRSTFKLPSLQTIFYFSLLALGFFAFLFAVLNFVRLGNIPTSYPVEEHHENQVKQRYSIGVSVQGIESGTVLSFCDEGSVCPGLGPRWSSSQLLPSGTLSPAVYAGLVQLSPTTAIYAYASFSSLNLLRIAAINTTLHSPTYLGSPLSLNVGGSVGWVSVKAFANVSNAFAVAYTTNSSLYVQVGSIGTTGLTLGSPVPIVEIPFTTDGFVVDLAIAGSWVIVTYATNYNGASYSVFAYNPNVNTFLSRVQLNNMLGLQITNAIASIYLGSGYFLQSTADRTLLGFIDFGSLSMTIVKVLSHPGSVFYKTLSSNVLFNNYISLVGMQIDGVDDPLAVSLVLQWADSQPFLSAFAPSNVFVTEEAVPHDFQISSCYIPPSTREPRGELFFSYADANTHRAKVFRAKVTEINGQVQLLPSPSLDISTFAYHQYGNSIAPLVACPSQIGGVLVAYQYLGTYMNSFVWEGGYRFAGIAQENWTATQTSITDVLVLREGISDAHSHLQPGFSYYLHNSGRLHPYTSLVELFTPNSFTARIGVAISDSQLLLDPYVFESLTKGE